MDDVWDETGTENDVISMTSAKHENNLKTAAFKTALDETDTETFLQQGFNEGFKEAAIKFRALGKCKGLLCSLLIFYDRCNKNPPDRVFEFIKEIDELRNSPSTQLYKNREEESETMDELSDLLSGANSKNQKNDGKNAINPDFVRIFEKEVQTLFDNALKIS